MSAWHAKRTEEVLKELGTGRDRAFRAEAGKRLGRYGRNELEHQEPDGMLRRFLAQMRDPMILVLLAAAILSLLASGGEDWIDAVIILVIVVVNAIISISQDSAEKA
ncbi:MAG: cation-transporting P-type ATPase [Intestinimonas sp.]